VIGEGTPLRAFLDLRAWLRGIPRLGLDLEDPKWSSFPNMMNFLNFRSLTKQKVPEKYVPSILEDS
jgi:hypothetical protein